MTDKKTRLIKVERVDDIPILMYQLQTMQVAACIDQFYPMRLDRGALSYFYLGDRLGSVGHLADANGVLQQSYKYDAFGNIVQQTGPLSQPFTYTGREWDAATGLYYYRARYYDPTIGRFISEDPIGFLDGINFYTYVNNNPINFTDPSGNFAIALPWVISGAIWVGEAVVGAAIGYVTGTAIVRSWERARERDRAQPQAPAKGDEKCDKDSKDCILVNWIPGIYRPAGRRLKGTWCDYRCPDGTPRRLFVVWPNPCPPKVSF